MGVEGGLGSEAVEGEGDEMRDLGFDQRVGDEAAAGVEEEAEKEDYRSNFEAISCQSESEGSSDLAGEGDAGEGGAAEEGVGSVEGMRNLVSGCLSDVCNDRYGV